MVGVTRGKAAATRDKAADTGRVSSLYLNFNRHRADVADVVGNPTTEKTVLLGFPLVISARERGTGVYVVRLCKLT